MTEWPAYLAAYHHANPGITEDLLIEARDELGRTPYQWLAEAVPARALVVDLAAGSGPVARLLERRRVVAVDRSGAELARARASGVAALVRADAAALPLRGGRAGALTVSMALMLVSPLDVVLAEARRLLASAGVLVATVPSRSDTGTDRASLRLFREVLAALGQAATPYPEPLEGAGLADRFAAAGLELAEDVTGRFARPVRTAADAGLVVRSFYAPGTTPEQVAAAAEALGRRAALGPLTVTYSLRRLVAVAR